MNLGKDEARFIDSLRAAAKEFGAVSDLLDAIKDGLLIDDLGNIEIDVDATDLFIFKAAQIAAAFSELDRSEP